MTDEQAIDYIKSSGATAEVEASLLGLYRVYRKKGMNPGASAEKVLLVRLDILRGGSGDPENALREIEGGK